MKDDSRLTYLKDLYYELNGYIQNDLYDQAIKFVTYYKGEEDVSILRMMIDILKQVKDIDIIKPHYDELITLIEVKIGKIY